MIWDVLIDRKGTQTQQKQTQYDIATKKAEIEKYDESIKNATVNSTMIGVVKKTILILLTYGYRKSLLTRGKLQNIISL